MGGLLATASLMRLRLLPVSVRPARQKVSKSAVAEQLFSLSRFAVVGLFRAAVRGRPGPACVQIGSGLRAAETAWEEYWAAIRPVELTAAVEQHAGRLTGRHALRGADAVHLASALAIADPDLVLAVWDRRLHAGATAAGLRVAPAQLN